MHCEACARKVARSLKGFQGPSIPFFNLYIIFFIFLPTCAASTSMEFLLVLLNYLLVYIILDWEWEGG